MFCEATERYSLRDHRLLAGATEHRLQRAGVAARHVGVDGVAAQVPPVDGHLLGVAPDGACVRASEASIWWTDCWAAS